MNFLYKNQINILFLFLIFYTQIFSPVISDDWYFHYNYNDFMPDRPLSSFFIIKIHQLINKDFIFDGFKFFKMLYLFLAYLFLYKIYSLILNKEYSQFFSFFTIFYPIHDSANYQIWFIGHLLVMTIPLFSYYLLLKDQKYKAYFLFGISSFISYSSLPSQFSIIIEKIKNKFFLRAFFLCFLLATYIVYYFLIVFYFNIGNSVNRIGVGLEKDYLEIIYNIVSIKNIAIHLITFIDVLLGPSHFLKIYLAVKNNSLISLILSIFLTYYIFLLLKKNKFKFDMIYFKKCFFIVTLSLIFAQILFIITTKFINIPFGLGNRTNIYTSLFVALVFIFTINFFNKKILISIIFLFFLCFFGNLNYWKKTNTEIELIKNEIINLSNNYKDHTILLKNIEYINIFQFKHIELFNDQSYLDNFIISNKIETNNNYFYILKDIEIKKYENIEKILIYDFKNKNILLINNYNELFENYKNYRDFYTNRHWIQMINFSYLYFLLPEHYMNKFINLTKKI